MAQEAAKHELQCLEKEERSQSARWTREGPGSEGPSVSPADEPQWAWPVLVHQEAQRQRGRTEQERANGEAQIEHLFLLHTAGPGAA